MQETLHCGGTQRFGEGLPPSHSSPTEGVLAFGAGAISGALAGALLQGFDLLDVFKNFLSVIKTALQDAAPLITNNSRVKELLLPCRNLHAKTCWTLLTHLPAVLCRSSPGTE